MLCSHITNAKSRGLLQTRISALLLFLILLLLLLLFKLRNQHEACQQGSLDIVRILLESGADVHAASHFEKDTPLHDAVCANAIDIALVRKPYCDTM